MGRAKLNMELISKEKSRNTTFKKRKEGLIRKMHEFTTLCDVSACMIIYGPKQENGPVEPEIWPQNAEEVHRIIETYKSKKKDSGNKTFGLNDFFHERKRKIEDDLSKLRRRNLEAKYPTPPDKFLDSQSEGQLRAFSLALSSKAELVRAKIEVMKRSSTSKQIEMNDVAGLKGQFYPQPRDMHVPFPIYYDHHTVNQKSMMMLLMNGEDQFGGASSSSIGGNIQCASFKQEIFYERALPVPLPLPRYYVPPPQLSLPTPPYMVAPPQLPFPAAGWEGQDAAHEDAVKYHEMKNYRG